MTMAPPREPAGREPIVGVLIDIDGVVHVRDALLPGSLDALEKLRRAGVPYKFITNTTRRPRRAIQQDLARLGVAASIEDVYTPAALVRDFLASNGLAPFLVVHPDLVEDFADLPKGEAEAVVVGDAGDHFSYALLNEAFRRLMQGAPLLALAKNRYFQDRDQALSLDAGPFVAALEFAAQREALVFGKPAAEFFHSAVRGLGLRPGQVAMIGDDVEADVGGAMDAGLAGALVRTGKYRAGQETTLGRPPTLVADDLLAAVSALLG